MIKLTYKQLNGEFFGALQEIKELRMGAKAAYTVGKIIKRVDDTMKLARDEHLKLLAQFVHLNEDKSIKVFDKEPALDPAGKELIKPDGSPLYKPTEPFRFLSEGAEKEYNAFMNKPGGFFETEIEIDQNKIGLNQFGDAQVSPECMQALDPILTTLSTV